MAMIPMGSGNTPVDMVSGVPEVELAKQQRLEAAQEQVARGESLRKELEGQEGRTILLFALKLLENKVEKFVQSDPECATILNLLTELNYAANIGRKQALKSIRNIFGNNEPAWFSRLE
jgi:hypothetical protein